MSRITVELFLAVLIVTLAGCGKHEPKPTDAPSATTPPPVIAAPKEPPSPALSPNPVAAPAPAPAGPEIPKTEDVLPAGEVSKGSPVVSGDGCRCRHYASIAFIVLPQ